MQEYKPYFFKVKTKNAAIGTPQLAKEEKKAEFFEDYLLLYL